MDISFSQLSKVYFTISDLFADRQQAIGKKRFIMQNPRPTDALMLFSKINSICYQENEAPLYIPQGALVYVPKNSRYVWEDSPAYDDNELEKLLFEFTLNYVDTTRDTNNKISISSVTDNRISFGEKVTIISTKYSSYYKKNFEKLIKAFSDQSNSSLAVFSAAYEFFSILSDNCNSNEKNSTNLKIIEKGIRYIEQNPCPEKSIQEIADMCGVSVGYFERLFKSYAKVSPVEYINSQKILHIKKLLQNREISLEEIAEKLNYCDSSYLCRIFKKKTGMSPNDYRQLYFSSVNYSD